MLDLHDHANLVAQAALAPHRKETWGMGAAQEIGTWKGGGVFGGKESAIFILNC